MKRYPYPDLDKQIEKVKDEWWNVAVENGWELKATKRKAASDKSEIGDALEKGKGGTAEEKTNKSKYRQ